MILNPQPAIGSNSYQRALWTLFVSALMLCLPIYAHAQVVAWGDSSNGQTTIPAGLTGVKALAGSPSDRGTRLWTNSASFAQTTGRGC
jgi:hypothetical protein